MGNKQLNRVCKQFCHVVRVPVSSAQLRWVKALDKDHNGHTCFTHSPTFECFKPARSHDKFISYRPHMLHIKKNTTISASLYAILQKYLVRYFLSCRLFLFCWMDCIMGTHVFLVAPRLSALSPLGHVINLFLIVHAW
ncbi:hypothetical protein Nepgr_005587 [Nepenthes gracilis]|uniref:Uncharacterized protein n=1 Tax=Nepenthes gracilis TaxID=150966 RepID=A0AAD3XGL4_NEPGR|nr:hypothetical protein Nepgr_005587 [Nepenthes gracilis]